VDEFYHFQEVLMRNTIVVLIVYLMGTPLLAEEPEFRYQLTKNAADSITVEREKDAAVFTVKSASGIGAGSILLQAGDWPKQVSIRFQGFTNLEWLFLDTERLHIEGSLKESGRFGFCFRDAEQSYVRIEPGSEPWCRQAAGILKITAKEVDGSIVVTFPTAFLTGSKKLDLDWIDAFRR
jgi:hypothetical protein